MVKDLSLMFKQDTGQSNLKSIDTEMKVDFLDTRIMREMTKSEIIDLIDYDIEHNAINCVLVKDIPCVADYATEVDFYNPEYIKWLEDKLIERL